MFFGIPIPESVAPTPRVAPEPLPRGARVLVTDEDFGGEGVVVVPTVPGVEFTRVGIEFDGAPGFVWQFAREAVERV